MGTRKDAWWRNKRKRVDDSAYREAISKARFGILEKNYALHGKHVDGILKEQSLVPVEVNVFFCRAQL